MTDISVRRVHTHDLRQVAQWKDLLPRADGATIFHNPAFLAYHGDRFDEHHLACFKGETLLGILPFALAGKEGASIGCSPYGGSVGGWVFRPLDFATADALADKFITYLSALRLSRVRLTPPARCYFNEPSDTFEFCLLRRGFQAVNSDILSVVPLRGNIETDVFTSRVRNTARKAERLGVQCQLRAPLNDFWPLMELTFSSHQTRPTHSLDEWEWLMKHLPDDVWVDVAYLDGRPAAGIGHFRINERVDSSFYLCQRPAARQSQALSLLLCRAIMAAAREGYRHFDFGGSTLNMQPREGIFRFKEAFGAVGQFRHTYEMALA